MRYATHLLITSLQNEIELVLLTERSVSTRSAKKSHKVLILTKFKIFNYRLYTYYLDNGCFVPIETPFHSFTHEDIIH